MAAELRWILLLLSLPLLAGIWWWTSRRTRQAHENAELRESMVETLPALDPRYIDSDDAEARVEADAADWGVPPFEPLNIRSADFDRVPVLDGPMMVNVEPAPPAAQVPPMYTARHAPAARAAVEHPSPAQPAAAQPAAARTSALRSTSSVGSDNDNSDRFAGVTTPPPNVAESQRIVTIRVCAPGEGRWSGAQLAAALELHGLAFGRYQVFHRKHVDGRSLFCVASLVEPGTFDVAAMSDQEFRGVTLFAVLPGPIEPLATVDELFETARGLAQELSGMVQDAQGMPLSPQRAAALREDIARFQAMLPAR